MFHRSASRLSFALLTFLIVACSGAGGPAVTADPGWPLEETEFALIPVPVSTEIVVGQNRVLFNILDRQNRSIASPETGVELRFFELATSRTEPAVIADAAYTPTAEGRPGLYRAQVEFDAPGEWGVEAIATDASGDTRIGRMVMSVRETGTTPRIGAPAPATETPTAETEAEIARISTDDDPDPDFYDTSIREAVGDDRPFAVIFATPAFCRTATCGPALDVVKEVAADFEARMDFIHVEPYELEIVEGRLRPVLTENNLPVPVPATNEWGLPTEPYIFVVDRDGNVSAKFEGVAASEELRAAFDAVTSG